MFLRLLGRSGQNLNPLISFYHHHSLSHLVQVNSNTPASIPSKKTFSPRPTNFPFSRDVNFMKGKTFLVNIFVGSSIGIPFRLSFLDRHLSTMVDDCPRLFSHIECKSLARQIREMRGSRDPLNCLYLFTCSWTLNPRSDPRNPPLASFSWDSPSTLMNISSFCNFSLSREPREALKFIKNFHAARRARMEI